MGRARRYHGIMEHALFGIKTNIMNTYMLRNNGSLEASPVLPLSCLADATRGIPPDFELSVVPRLIFHL